MKRAAWIALGIVLIAALAVIGVRIYQDRPQPARWVLAHPAGPKPARPVPPSATSFAITINTGQCNPEESPLDRIEVEEGSESVTATAYIEPPGSPLAPQFTVAQCLSFAQGTVQLAEPLGSRELRVGGFESSDPMRETP